MTHSVWVIISLGFEMAQKVMEGGIVTWRHMYEILRWLNFKLAQILRSRVKTLR